MDAHRNIDNSLYVTIAVVVARKGRQSKSILN